MSEEKLILRLYVTGQSLNSEKASANIRKLLDEETPDRYQLEIIDVLKQPARAEQDGIIATPTLLKLQPLPVCRIIGDLSNRERVLSGLGIALPAMRP